MLFVHHDAIPYRARVVAAGSKGWMGSHLKQLVEAGEL